MSCIHFTICFPEKKKKSGAERQTSVKRKMWMKRKMKLERSKMEMEIIGAKFKGKRNTAAETETERMDVTRKGEVGGTRWMDRGAEVGRQEGKEGESNSSVQASLPAQRGLLPAGTQTLSPCPALYSHGYCSQIHPASYPV